ASSSDRVATRSYPETHRPGRTDNDRKCGPAFPDDCSEASTCEVADRRNQALRAAAFCLPGGARLAQPDLELLTRNPSPANQKRSPELFPRGDHRSLNPRPTAAHQLRESVG